MTAQMVSLLHLAVITEEGVAFQSPHDGRDMLLTPEHSIAIQNRLGAAWLSFLTLETARTCVEEPEKSNTMKIRLVAPWRSSLNPDVPFRLRVD